jgi:hypothetical protein
MVGGAKAMQWRVAGDCTSIKQTGMDGCMSSSRNKASEGDGIGGLTFIEAEHTPAYSRAREWFVIHDTNCGMELFTDEVIADLLEDDLATLPLMARLGRIPTTMAVTRLVTSSSGTRPRIRSRALFRMYAASGSTRRFQRTCQSTGTSTTCEPDVSTS